MSRDPVPFSLMVAGMLFSGVIIRDTRGSILLRERNFFGVREVREDKEKQMHLLMHGTTKHGAQSTDPAKRREPFSYYYRGGPLGDFFRALPPVPGRKVAVIGLGAGGLAAYAGEREAWTFYEIDPDIARVARDTQLFTYLRDTPAEMSVILGDGRLEINKAPQHGYDLIVLDAFTSDAIPLHLLTAEAFSAYRSRLAPDGVLLLHLSNRYLDLEFVLARLVQASGLSGLIRVNTGLTREVLEAGGDPSIWAAVAPRTSLLGALNQHKDWRPLRTREDVALWTDDFSNIWTVFHLPQKGPPKLAPIPAQRRDSSAAAPGVN